MKVLDKLLIRSFLGPFLMTFLVVQFVLILQFLWKYIDEMVGKGLGISVISELIFYASATLIPMALPLAVLLSSIMTFGNLAEKFELTAVKSSGVSLLRFMRPLVVLNIFIAIGAFFFANDVLPKSYLKFAQLIYDVRQKKPALDIKPGVFYNEIDNYVIRIEEKSADNEELQGIKIWDHTSKNGNLRIITADHGNMSLSGSEHFLILNLYDGFSYEELDGANFRTTLKPFVRTDFNSQQINFDLSLFKFDETDESLFKDHNRMMNVTEIDSVIKKEESGMVARKEQLLDYVSNSYIFGNDSLYDKLDASVHAVPNDFLLDKDKLTQTRIRQEALSNIRSAKGYLNMLNREQEFTIKNLQGLYVEWHKKFTLATACFLLFLIGVPLGAIVRKGGFGIPVLMSIILFLFYYMISIVAEKYAKNLMYDPFTSIWAPTFILLPLAVFLLVKANNDSKLLDMEFYKKMLRKLIGK